MQTMTVSSITPDLCFGCAACMDKCSFNAIHMDEDVDGNRRPFVDAAKCKSCGLCVKVCPQLNSLDVTNYARKYYVGYIKDRIVSSKSSSGGIFAALATFIIKRKRGIVYGASMEYDGKQLFCHHKRIEKIEDLYRLQGSKYIQSRTDGVFQQVKADLVSGRTVLFSGTSCQVASLKRFIGKCDCLYTVDLVCHGVPKDSIYRDYIDYLEKTKTSKVSNISFRSKGQKHFGKEVRYLLSLDYENGEGNRVRQKIPTSKSLYYQLFLNRSGYRESCYHCRFASLNKPGDITLGDFLPRQSEIMKYSFCKEENYSSVIINSENGSNILKSIVDALEIVEISEGEMLSHHYNLQFPSAITSKGKKLLKQYQSVGVDKAQRILEIQYIKSEIKSMLKYLLCFKWIKR